MKQENQEPKSITRNFIQSIIKNHYEMISKLEKLLEEFPVIERVQKYKRRPPQEIIEAVNEVFNTNCQEPTRRKRVVEARHCAVYMLRQYTDMTLNEIGEIMSGDLHHTTVLHSIKTCKNWVDIDDDFAQKFNQAKILIEAKLQFI